ETLQQYHFAAKQSGIETSALNSGLERFQRKVAEAHQGTGTFGKELERLGIALVDNNGFVRDGTAVFEDYLAAIGKTHNSQEQLRLAFVAFGREGASLVNLAKEGGEGFANLRNESERLGTVLSVGLLRNYKAINDQLDANQQRLESLRLKNSLFLAQIALKWDNLKTSIKAATLELIAFLNPLETRSVANLSAKLKETETAIERTKNALNSSIANLPLVTGVLEVFLGGLIEDQERILEAIKIAKGEQLQVKAERPEDVTAQINEQIAARELELSQQQRLLEAAKQGEEARLRVAAAIQAENDARALGAQATIDEQERIRQTSLALAETELALEKVTAANQNFAAGEELRLQALEKIGTAAAQTDQALLSNVESLLILGNASVKTQLE
ncbi:MAG: hypothetical protein L0241_31110, partial [Planctomycetia bacterium]|nr:hypothetical protein [Planctomycetia bacterium]